MKTVEALNGLLCKEMSWLSPEESKFKYDNLLPDTAEGSQHLLSRMLD